MPKHAASSTVEQQASSSRGRSLRQGRANLKRFPELKATRVPSDGSALKQRAIPKVHQDRQTVKASTEASKDPYSKAIEWSWSANCEDRHSTTLSDLQFINPYPELQVEGFQSTEATIAIGLISYNSDGINRSSDQQSDLHIRSR